MTEITPDKDTLELVFQLARIYTDGGFRTRVENDELKQAAGEGEILLQFEPDRLKEAEVLFYRLGRWTAARSRMARERQNERNARVFGTDAMEKYSKLLQDEGASSLCVDVRPDELTPAFSALQESLLLQGHG